MSAKNKFQTYKIQIKNQMLSLIDCLCNQILQQYNQNYKIALTLQTNLKLDLFHILKEQIMKPRNSESSLNKNQILQWINAKINCSQTKIESLGNGIIYCLLMNHFYPNSIPKNKIIMVPRNNVDNKKNLRKVHQALNLFNIKSISFDILRVSQMSYLDNWQLITKFHRHFQELQKNSEKQTEKYKQVNQIHTETNQNHSQIINQNQNLLQSQSQIHNVLNTVQQNYILMKQVSKAPDFNFGLLTPMKGLKYFDQNTKMRCQALKIMQEIKNIVKSETQSDKFKVKNLKRMLGLIEQQSQQEELELKQLFSDCKNKQQIITID